MLTHRSQADQQRTHNPCCPNPLLAPQSNKTHGFISLAKKQIPHSALPSKSLEIKDIAPCTRDDAWRCRYIPKHFAMYIKAFLIASLPSIFIPLSIPAQNPILPDSLWQKILQKADTSAYGQEEMNIKTFCIEKSGQTQKCFTETLQKLLEAKHFRQYAYLAKDYYWHLRKILQYEQGLSVLQKALRITQKHQLIPQEKMLLLTLGQYYARQPNYDSAFYFLKQYELRTNETNDTLPWEYHRLYGIIWEDLGLIQKAKNAYLNMYHRGKKEITSRSQYGYMLYLISDFLFKYEDSLSAFAKYYNEYLEFLLEGNPNFMQDPLHYGRLLIGDTSSMEKLKDAIQIHKNNKYYTGELISTITLARLYQQTGQYQKTIDLLTRQSSLMDTVAFYSAKETYHRLLIEAYQKLHQYRKASQWQDRLLKLQKENFNRQIADNISKWEVKYETQKTEKQLLKKELELSKSKLEKQLLIGLTSALLIISTLIFYYTKRRISLQKQLHEQENRLKLQQIEELKTKNRQTALEHLIEGQEKERSYIARELHDSLGSLISTIKAYFNSLKFHLPNEADQKTFQKTNELLRETAEELRRITHHMAPVTLQRAGLKASLQDLFLNLKKSNIKVKQEIINLREEQLTEKQKTNIYRILQELCNNIIKHAQAQNALIQIIHTPTHLQILVEDDGIGYDYQKALNKKTIGLQNILSRVQLLRAEMDVHAEPNKGCSVSITIPLE